MREERQGGELKVMARATTTGALTALRRVLPNAPHSALNKLLRQGKVRTRLNRKLRPSHAVANPSDVHPPEWAVRQWGRSGLTVYELAVADSEELLVVTKPAGMPCQNGPGVSKRERTVEGIAAEEGLRLVHRLDAGASGALALAKTERAAERARTAFRERSAAKGYVALVRGSPAKRRGVVADPVGGKRARTEWHLLGASDCSRLSLLRLRPVTGRMHQLRVHCAHSLGLPIIGDARYGDAVRAERAGRRPIYLHSEYLKLPGLVEAEAPVPPHMRRLAWHHGLSSKL